MAVVVLVLRVTGLLRWATRVIPVPVIKGIQFGAGLSLVISAGTSLLRPLLLLLFASLTIRPLLLQSRLLQLPLPLPFFLCPLLLPPLLLLLLLVALPPTTYLCFMKP